MILKQFRFTVECTLDVEDLTREMVHRILKPLLNHKEAIKNEETWESAERQRRLLHVLLQDKIALEKIVRVLLSWRVPDLLSERLESQLEVEEETDEKIILPLLKRMSPEDADGFAKVMESDEWFIDLLMECFILKLDRTTISEVNE